jgi:periplasmic protein TonB
MAFPDHNRAPLLASIPPALLPQDWALPWACSLCFHSVALAMAAMAAVGLRELPKDQPPVVRLEILLTETQQIGEQTSTTDLQDQTDLTTAPETAVSTEHSAPRVPAPSPSVHPEPSNLVEPRPLPNPSAVQRTAQHVISKTPALQTTDRSSTANDPFPVENFRPIEQQSEPMTSANEPEPPALLSPSVTAKQTELTTATGSTPEPMVKPLHDPVEPSPQQHENTFSTPTPPTSLTTSHADASGSPTGPATETLAMNHSAITQSVSARSQYAWLLDLLRRRIVSLQAYPGQARMQGWEGVVVVKTTINSDGNLLDAVITKSSGYSTLDEDALKLMHRVCPVYLPQDLGKSQIAVLVPIRYKLDGLE